VHTLHRTTDKWHHSVATM